MTSQTPYFIHLVDHTTPTITTSPRRCHIDEQVILHAVPYPYFEILSVSSSPYQFCFSTGFSHDLIRALATLAASDITYHTAATNKRTKNANINTVRAITWG